MLRRKRMLQAKDQGTVDWRLIEEWANMVVNDPGDSGFSPSSVERMLARGFMDLLNEIMIIRRGLLASVTDRGGKREDLLKGLTFAKKPEWQEYLENETAKQKLASL
jgi:hypothetical protein